MTNKQALIAVLRINVPDDTLEKALLDHDVDGAANYTKDNATNIDLCAIDVFAGLLAEPDVTEGGYSVKYDRKAVQERLVLLAKKHNVTEILNQYKPSVKCRPVW